MSVAEILRHTEDNISLFLFTTEELQEALSSATREIHRYVLTREIAYRSKKHKPGPVSGKTKHRGPMGRHPSRRDLK